jgi:MSHA biogenesis protein MshJ
MTTSNKFQERYDSLTSREKVIVVTALIAALWAFWDGVLHEPFVRKQRELNQQLIGVNTELAGQQQLATELKNSSKGDPNADNQNKLTELKAQYTRLQEQVMLGSKKFVPPQLMAKALSDMLKQNHQLTLVKLESMPPTTLLEAQQQQKPIYKHGLEITFTGTYFDAINYLQSLEALPWAIVWDNLDYRVTSFPMAEITIRVVTLSFEKDWLGV